MTGSAEELPSKSETQTPPNWRANLPMSRRGAENELRIGSAGASPSI